MHNSIFLFIDFGYYITHRQVNSPFCYQRAITHNLRLQGSCKCSYHTMCNQKPQLEDIIWSINNHSVGTERKLERANGLVRLRPARAAAAAAHVRRRHSDWATGNPCSRIHALHAVPFSQ